MAKALTARAVETLKPDPDRRLEIADGLLPGLYLVVQPSGTKSWAVRYRSNGKPAKLTLGKYPALELSKARELARDNLLTVAKGDDPAAEKRQAKAATVTLPDTLGALCDSYVTYHLKPKIRRWEAAAGEIDNHIRPRLGDMPLADLTKAHVRAAIREIAQEHPVAANRALARIKAVLNWGVEEDLVEANVAQGVKRPTEEAPVDRVLNDDELRAVWQGTEALGYPAHEFARLLILTGQRRDDVRLMAWEEIDLVNRVWTIPRDRYKSGRPHLVPLPEAAVEILKALPFRDRGGFVLSLNGGTKPYSNVTKPKRRLDKVSGATGWTWHDLRRTCRTTLSRLGIRREVAERVIGHSVGGKLDKVYDLWEFSAEKRAALKAWAAHVEGIESDDDKVVAIGGGHA
jgi:integrase